MIVVHSIPVTYESTNNIAEAKEWLEELPELFAADFEAAVRYSDEEIAQAKENTKDHELSKKERIHFQTIANATALGHPSHCLITHCSIAWSERESRVFIIDSEEIKKLILDFLTTTKRKQIWHNYCYDGRLIRYFTGKDAIDIEDAQILAKTLLNHVDIFKASSRLKDLMGEYYGDWGIDSDYFHVSQQYEEKVLKYSAIDACATYKLWELLNDFITKNRV
jgi:hypothetical protein